MGPEVIAGAPGIFSDAVRAAFIELVRQGGEVGDDVLERNVRNAKSLVFLRLAGDLVGVAALKNPIPSYPKRIGESAGFKIDAKAFPYELGYIFVVPQARGNGFSRVLAETAIGQADGSGIFATARTDNAAMRSTLLRVGFEAKGVPYVARDKERFIQIFVLRG
ncbi:GNAT family N-acetyltransferase [Labrys portucalensis]|uniref:GNAT family N-acetyltransferase n=1 Tax=Labrys neptuniae TaxID=376174 RepID=A0ABV6ZRE4_9HYPH